MRKTLFSLIVLFLTSCSNNLSSSMVAPLSSSSNVDYSKMVRVVACSDYQDDRGHIKSQENVLDILMSMEENGIDEMNGFLCCGDYDYGYEDSVNGIASLKDAISYYIEEENMVFAQGNHDEILSGTNGLAKSGDNDPISNEYGVFVINEDDYMWYNNNALTIKNTAYKLQSYLNEKIEEDYNKPIFILSHLALNYSMRTYYDGDGQYASFIFDVLNEASNLGLNIIYLFGHNHSNGWDDYLGGSSVYLTKGDSILIADNSKEEFSERILNFTYMNAGYVGYYRNVNEGADTTLTMTVFDIYYDKVIINRYSKDGLHLLKSQGVTNVYKNETQYEPNIKEYPSPQINILEKNIANNIISIIPKNKNYIVAI